MAIHLTFEYGKRLGLPGYSSHTFGVTAKAEVNAPAQIAQESARMYQVLQQSVDSQIINEGFVPGTTGDHQPNGTNGNQRGNVAYFPGGNQRQPHQHGMDTTSWKCSAKQTDLILKIMEENQLPPDTADTLATELHGKAMSGLTKLEASGVVSEFISRYRRSRSRNSNSQPTR